MARDKKETGEEETGVKASAIEGTGKDNEKEGEVKGPPAAPRKIPGNLPYLTASGTLKKVLDGLVEAQRPEKFNPDFLENVLKLTGGSARATVPLMKKMGLLTSEGAPTELYARFKTEGGRGPAALHAIKATFPEIFKRSEYAHTVADTKLRDIIVEITGLKQNDPIIGYIRSTFNIIKGYIAPGTVSDEPEDHRASRTEEATISESTTSAGSLGLSLAYNINIVLPETSDLMVLNAIFRSIKDNLLK